MTGETPHTVVHTIGSRVWLRDEAEGWVKGEVIKLDGDHIVVALEDSKQQRRVPQEEAPLQNNDTRGVEVCSRARAPGAVAVRMRARWGPERTHAQAAVCWAVAQGTSGRRLTKHWAPRLVDHVEAHGPGPAAARIADGEGGGE